MITVPETHQIPHSANWATLTAPHSLPLQAVLSKTSLYSPMLPHFN